MRLWLNIILSRSPLVDIDHALATVVARTEAHKISPPISVPASTSEFAMSRQSGPEPSLAVGDHAVLISLSLIAPHQHNTHSPLSPSLPHPMMQRSQESEKNSVSYLHCFFSFFLSLTDSGFSQFESVFECTEFSLHWWYLRESFFWAV